MAGVFLAGARFSIQRLHAHVRHDRAHMWMPDHEPLTSGLFKFPGPPLYVNVYNRALVASAYPTNRSPCLLDRSMLLKC